MKVETIKRNAAGELPAFAWPGGYSIFYLDHGGNVLCADCATASLRYNDDQTASDADVYWEGPTINCEECNAPIDSAYGNPLDNV